MAGSQRMTSSKAEARDQWLIDDEDRVSVDEFKSLSREDARLIAGQSTLPSPWVVLGWQLAVGVMLAFALRWVSAHPAVFESALYGCVAVVFPGAVFARGLQRQRSVAPSGVALSGFFVWELVKIVLVLVLLAAAPVLVANLSWLALLAGLVISLKTSWFVLLWCSKVRRGC